jgi:hypothetical protein
VDSVGGLINYAAGLFNCYCGSRHSVKKGGYRKCLVSLTNCGSPSNSWRFSIVNVGSGIGLSCRRSPEYGGIPSNRIAIAKVIPTDGLSDEHLELVTAMRGGWNGHIEITYDHRVLCGPNLDSAFSDLIIRLESEPKTKRTLHLVKLFNKEAEKLFALRPGYPSSMYLSELKGLRSSAKDCANVVQAFAHSYESRDSEPFKILVTKWVGGNPVGVVVRFQDIYPHPMHWGYKRQDGFYALVDGGCSRVSDQFATDAGVINHFVSLNEGWAAC